MELKLLYIYEIYYPADGSNRTFMELKLILYVATEISLKF